MSSGADAAAARVASLQDAKNAKKRPPRASKKKSAAQEMVELVLASGAELWHTPSPDGFLSAAVNGHVEHHKLRSGSGRRYLTGLYYGATGKAPGSQALQDAVATLDAICVHGRPAAEVALRVGGAGGRVYLDLGRADWSVVEVGTDGWRVVESKASPVRFRRPRGLGALPVPVRGGRVDALRSLLRVSDSGWALAAAWMVAALRPVGPYPVLLVQGEQGAGKSCGVRTMRRVIDPSVCGLRSLPREDRDLAIAAGNGWVVSYDNVSSLPVWLSDALCRLATGGGFGTRQLYSDDEETLIDAVRPVVLNGITDVVSRPDLADRCLMVTLEAIDDDSRREESKYWVELDGISGEVLGGLLDAVSSGLARLPDVRLPRLPRMADFAVWATACEAGLGLRDGEILEAYAGVRRDLVAVTLDGDPVAGALLRWLDGRAAERLPDEWRGTSSALFSELAATFGERRPPSDWPTTARGLSGTLRRLVPALRAQHVEVVAPREGGRRGHGGARMWVVRDSREQSEGADRHHRHHSQEVNGGKSLGGDGRVTVVTVGDGCGDGPGDCGDGRGSGCRSNRHPGNAMGAGIAAGGDGGDGSSPYPSSCDDGGDDEHVL